MRGGTKEAQEWEGVAIPRVSGVSKQCHVGPRAQRDSMFHISCTVRHEQTDRGGGCSLGAAQRGGKENASCCTAS